MKKFLFGLFIVFILFGPIYLNDAFDTIWLIVGGAFTLFILLFVIFEKKISELNRPKTDKDHP